MNWFGVTPLKKFPAPVRTSIVLHSVLSRTMPCLANSLFCSQADGPLLRRWYVTAVVVVVDLDVNLHRPRRLRSPGTLTLGGWIKIHGADCVYRSRHRLWNQRRTKRLHEQYDPAHVISNRFNLDANISPLGAEFKNDPRNPNAKSAH